MADDRVSTVGAGPPEQFASRRETEAVFSPSIDTVRVFLRLFAAAVWVGGQVTLAGTGAIGALFLVTLLTRHG